MRSIHPPSCFICRLHRPAAFLRRHHPLERSTSPLRVILTSGRLLLKTLSGGFSLRSVFQEGLSRLPATALGDRHALPPAQAAQLCDFLSETFLFAISQVDPLNPKPRDRSS